MAKTNKQNPLKYFNDAFDNKKASMKKALIKAQVGYTNLQGPISKEAANEVALYSLPTVDRKKYGIVTDSIISRPKTVPEMAKSQHQIKKLMDAQRNPALREDSPEYDNAAYRKKGGQTKSKKK